jgi:acetone carboxylase gamma subunit
MQELKDHYYDCDVLVAKEILHLMSIYKEDKEVAYYLLIVMSKFNLKDDILVAYKD